MVWLVVGMANALHPNAKPSHALLPASTLDLAGLTLEVSNTVLRNLLARPSTCSVHNQTTALAIHKTQDSHSAETEYTSHIIRMLLPTARKRKEKCY